MKVPVRLAAGLGAAAARLGAATWRCRRIHPDDGGPRATDGRLAPAVYALWHEHLLPLAVHYRARDVVVLVSLHRDGEALARVLEGMGYATARGSSSRGGGAGLRALAAAGRERRPIALAPDGPRGPRRRCKPGVVQAAAATGLPIVPVAAAATRGWRLPSWDRFLLPAPGAGVVICEGAPIRVPSRPSGAELEAWAARVGGELDRVATVCERAVRDARRPRVGGWDDG